MHFYHNRTLGTSRVLRGPRRLRRPLKILSVARSPCKYIIISLLNTKEYRIKITKIKITKLGIQNLELLEKYCIKIQK